jgi:hypothetical protein
MSWHLDRGTAMKQEGKSLVFSSWAAGKHLRNQWVCLDILTGTAMKQVGISLVFSSWAAGKLLRNQWVCLDNLKGEPLWNKCSSRWEDKTYTYLFHSGSPIKMSRHTHWFLSSLPAAQDEKTRLIPTCFIGVSLSRCQLIGFLAVQS